MPISLIVGVVLVFTTTGCDPDPTYFRIIEAYASGPDHNSTILHRLLCFGSHGGLRTSLARGGLI